MNDRLPFGSSRDDFVNWLYGQYYDQLYFQALKLCKGFKFPDSYADDLVQDIFIKVLRDHEKVYIMYQVKGIAYLKRMLINQMKDTWRQKKSQLKNEQEYVVRHAVDIPVDLYNLCPEIPVEYLLDNLKPYLTETDHQLLSYHLNGYKYEEIGRKMNMNPQTVSTKVFRAKKRLRLELQEERYLEFTRDYRF